MKVSLTKRHYNAYIFPYKYAKPGDDVVVRMTNLDQVWEERDFTADNACEYTKLPSANGDLNGLLVEWYSEMQMWTVYFYNPHNPCLDRFRAEWDGSRRSWGVKDTEALSPLWVAHTQTEAAARVVARKRNKEV